MFSRRRLPLALAAAGACLLLASGAGAAPEDTFTAAITPSHVKGSSAANYTMLLTNTSPSLQADRATITIPDGFDVTENSVNASASAVPPCVASDWNPNVNDERIRVDRPTGGGGGGNRHLCPGATLTVVFQASSPATDGPFSWNPSLRGENGEEEVDFHLSGTAPTVTVDGTAPTVTISQHPPNPSNSRSASFVFTVSEPASTVCKLDNAAAACSAAHNGLADGVHTFTVTATDAVGNSGQASYTWTVDATAPVATIVQKPLDPSNSTTASFGFIVTGSTSIACKVDDSEFSPCSSPVSYNNLGDGPHTFTVRGTDAAGNTADASYSWRVETRAPTAAVASGPAALTNSRTASFTFTADEPSSFGCELDGGGFQPCTSPANYAGLGDGAHTFAVRPTDSVGNTGAAASYGWTIDATAPETTLGSAPRSGTTALSATFTFSASEPGSLECKLDAASFAPCSSPRSYTGLSRATHTFEVRGIDAVGNVDASAAVHRWTIAAPKRAKVTSALFAPRAGARITSPPLLAWRRAPRATYYNVQLFRGGVKVLSAWPVRTRLQLRTRWTYLGRQRRLTAGTYRWYVWPGYGRAAANRYGRMLGQSTFTFVAPGR